MDDTPTSSSEFKKPALYSEQALLVFSTLLNPVVGGLMTYSSLQAAGQPRAASHALWLSVCFAFLTYEVGHNLIYGTVFTAGLGYVWGRWLSQYMRRKVPDIGSYPRNNAMQALVLWLVGITVAVFGYHRLKYH